MYKNVVCRCARLPKYIHTNDLTNRIVSGWACWHARENSWTVHLGKSWLVSGVFGLLTMWADSTSTTPYEVLTLLHLARWNSTLEDSFQSWTDGIYQVYKVVHIRLLGWWNIGIGLEEVGIYVCRFMFLHSAYNWCNLSSSLKISHLMRIMYARSISLPIYTLHISHYQFVHGYDVTGPLGRNRNRNRSWRSMRTSTSNDRGYGLYISRGSYLVDKATRALGKHVRPWATID